MLIKISVKDLTCQFTSLLRLKCCVHFFELRPYLPDGNAKFSFQMVEEEEFWNLFYNELFGDGTLDQEMVLFHYLVWDLVGRLQSGQCTMEDNQV